ncbi:DUF4402 domain-containing protein [Altererythrobacter sp. ZODW24]|uniref:DUF4402 domain-containing protein n=1 Tax=Altererythrobacter sp. ZODW24 TaxID=2185142 RepID=UPI000DF84B49|nr:DUF4402 domain-containing protein [Altererythrobacter sp. ZODW24]
MTNKFRIGAAGVALVAALGMTSVANAADTATATAEAEVLSALTLTVATGSTLDFGQIAVNGAGTVALDPTDDSVVCSADLVCIGTTAAVDFEVTGAASQDVAITLPTGSVDLTLNGLPTILATETLELTAFLSDDADDVVQTDAAGDAGFAVGGTLTFDGTEVAGTYSGTFDVEVEYQ